MKIVKIPITYQNKILWRNSGKSKEGKRAWANLLNNAESMSAKEFWDNEYDKWYYEYPFKSNWFIVIGEPESIVDKLINLKIGETESCYYPHIVSNSPEDLIESRTSWEDLKRLADEMNDFINDLYRYI